MARFWLPRFAGPKVSCIAFSPLLLGVSEKIYDALPLAVRNTKAFVHSPIIIGNVGVTIARRISSQFTDLRDNADAMKAPKYEKSHGATPWILSASKPKLCTE